MSSPETSAAGAVAARCGAAPIADSTALEDRCARDGAAAYSAPRLSLERAWVLMHALYELGPLLESAQRLLPNDFEGESALLRLALRRSHELADGVLRLADPRDTIEQIVAQLRLPGCALPPWVDGEAVDALRRACDKAAGVGNA